MKPEEYLDDFIMSLSPYPKVSQMLACCAFNRMCPTTANNVQELAYYAVSHPQPRHESCVIFLVTLVESPPNKETSIGWVIEQIQTRLADLGYWHRQDGLYWNASDPLEDKDLEDYLYYVWFKKILDSSSWTQLILDAASRWFQMDRSVE